MGLLKSELVLSKQCLLISSKFPICIEFQMSTKREQELSTTNKLIVFK